MDFHGVGRTETIGSATTFLKLERRPANAQGMSAQCGNLTGEDFWILKIAQGPFPGYAAVFHSWCRSWVYSQRFPRAWDVDVPPGALSAALEALTIACQLIRVFDCGRAPCKGDGGNQANQQDARIFHRQLASSRIRGWPVFRSQSSFPVERANEPRWVEPGICDEVLPESRMREICMSGVPLSVFAFRDGLIAHHRHDTDKSESGKSKGACTGLG
jgi:hypothetical protein